MTPNEVMFCHHDQRLVVLSIVISIMAAFAARELVGRINEARGGVWLAWLAGASVVDGIGTCSMHYTGKLACHLPVPLLLDGRIVLLSLLVAISGSGATLLVLTRHKFSWGRALLGGILLGGWGVSALHYVSMAAIVQPIPQYRSMPLAITAVVLAMATSFGAIILAFRFPIEESESRWRNHASSILRGAANPVMHYTAMAGVSFSLGQVPDLSHTIGIWSIGVAGISIVPVMVLVVGLLTSLADRLQSHRAVLRRFSRRLVEVQEVERRHLARELHDEVGQALTAAKINVQSALTEGAATSAYLQDTTAILDRLLDQVRQISLDLRPSMLDDLGLVPALRSLLDQQGRRAAIETRFSEQDIPANLDAEVQTTCFRIAQEAITNVLRHAHATRIDIDLRSDKGKLRLLIRDNGIGFKVEPSRAQTLGLGLIGITERAALVGGRARIESSTGKGTIIEVALPLTLRAAGVSGG